MSLPLGLGIGLSGKANYPNFIDTFTGSTVNLENHTPDVGSGWTLTEGVAGTMDLNGAGVSRNTAVSATATTFLHDDMGTGVIFAQCTLKADTQSLGGVYCLVMRLVDTLNWGCSIELNGTGTWRVIQKDAGSVTVPTAITGALTGTFAASDKLAFELDDSSNALTVFQDTGAGFAEIGTATVTKGSGTRQGIVSIAIRNRLLLDRYEAGHIADGAFTAYRTSIYQATKAINTGQIEEPLATGVNAVVVNNDTLAEAISIGFIATSGDTATENTSVSVASGDVWIDVPAGMNYVVWWSATLTGTFQLGQGKLS